MFQSKEELNRYLNEPRIRCLECGRRFKSLGVHLRATHGMEPDDYREKYGIPYKIGLACPEVRETAREHASAYAQADPERMRQLSRLGKEKQKEDFTRRSMRDAPVIQEAMAPVTAKMRSVMLENYRNNGPSAAKIAAATRNISKANERMAAHGPTETQRKVFSRIGRIWGPVNLDKMLEARGITRTDHSPETVAAIKEERSKGASFAVLSRQFGIPKTTIQRLCAKGEEAHDKAGHQQAEPPAGV